MAANSRHYRLQMTARLNGWIDDTHNDPIRALRELSANVPLISDSGKVARQPSVIAFNLGMAVLHQLAMWALCLNSPLQHEQSFPVAGVKRR